jgi:hypothetical protein
MFVRPTVAPGIRLHRALEREDLHLVRLAVLECERVELDDALRILLLIREKEPDVYERAAVRWAGHLLASHPDLGSDRSGSAIRELSGLCGHERGVAASRLALLLRHVGAVREAAVLERRHGTAG